MTGAIAVLDSQKTAHAGTPRQATKLQAAKLGSSHCGESTALLYDTAIAFARSESEGAQEVRLVLLGPLFGAQSGGSDGYYSEVGGQRELGGAGVGGQRVAKGYQRSLRSNLSDGSSMDGACFPEYTACGGGWLRLCCEQLHLR